MRIGRGMAAAGGLLALAGAALVAPAESGAETLDVSIFHSQRSAWDHAFKFWADEIKKQTDGRVEFRPFYSGALSKIVETFKAVRDGAVPVGTTSAAHESGRIPALAYIEGEAGMPNDADAWVKVAGELRPILSELFDDKGVRFLWLQPSFGGTVNCRDRHLKNPADWKNLRVRTAGRWQVQQIRELGAKPVATDPAEQYLALQNRTIDCVLSNHEITYGFKLFEVAPKIVNLRVPVNVMIYLANRRTWERISKADRDVIERVSARAERIAADHLAPLQATLRAKIKAAGGDVYSLSDAEKAAFVNAIKPVFDRMDGESGAAGKRIRQILEPHW